jgi:hypothetical protein
MPMSLKRHPIGHLDLDFLSSNRQAAGSNPTRGATSNFSINWMSLEHSVHYRMLRT